MSKYTKMMTQWKPSEDGDLLCAHSGDPAWTNIKEFAREFPMSAQRVATLMNEAFSYGAAAKAEEIRHAMGAP